jgi:rare lipoprotein A
MRSLVVFMTAALVLSVACSRRPRLARESATMTQKGLASWYGRGDGYHGQPTASGEQFDRNDLTGAHYDLPFGSRVAVTNEKNGKRVVVSINDRLPQVSLRKGRIIDLSYRAAQLLEMVEDGVVPVTLQVLPCSESED